MCGKQILDTTYYKQSGGGDGGAAAKRQKARAADVNSPPFDIHRAATAAALTTPRAAFQIFLVLPQLADDANAEGEAAADESAQDRCGWRCLNLRCLFVGINLASIHRGTGQEQVLGSLPPHSRPSEPCVCVWLIRRGAQEATVAPALNHLASAKATGAQHTGAHITAALAQQTTGAFLAAAPPFAASAAFTGPRPGFYFGTGSSGTGYYVDPEQRRLVSWKEARAHNGTQSQILASLGLRLTPCESAEA